MADQRTSSPQSPQALRIDQLRADLADLRRRRPAPTRERLLLRLGGLLLVVGPAWIAVEYVVSHSTRSGLQQRDAIIGALFGLALTLAGAVLFLRYSSGRLYRYGISRLLAALATEDVLGDQPSLPEPAGRDHSPAGLP